MVYMPFEEDDETHALIGRLEQHRARLLEIMADCGADCYEIGLIRQHAGTDSSLIEAWLVPMFNDEEKRRISEFDRQLETDEGALLVHVVNWPEYWDSYIAEKHASEQTGDSSIHVLDWGKWTDTLRQYPDLSSLSLEEQLRGIRALGFDEIQISFQDRGSLGADD